MICNLSYQNEINLKFIEHKAYHCKAELVNLILMKSKVFFQNFLKRYSSFLCVVWGLKKSET